MNLSLPSAPAEPTSLPSLATGFAPLTPGDAVAATAPAGSTDFTAVLAATAPAPAAATVEAGQGTAPEAATPGAPTGIFAPPPEALLQRLSSAETSAPTPTANVLPVAIATTIATQQPSTAKCSDDATDSETTIVSPEISTPETDSKEIPTAPRRPSAKSATPEANPELIASLIAPPTPPPINEIETSESEGTETETAEIDATIDPVARREQEPDSEPQSPAMPLAPSAPLTAPVATAAFDTALPDTASSTVPVAATAPQTPSASPAQSTILPRARVTTPTKSRESVAPDASVVRSLRQIAPRTAIPTPTSAAEVSQLSAPTQSVAPIVTSVPMASAASGDSTEIPSSPAAVPLGGTSAFSPTPASTAPADFSSSTRSANNPPPSALPAEMVAMRVTSPSPQPSPSWSPRGFSLASQPAPAAAPSVIASVRSSKSVEFSLPIAQTAETAQSTTPLATDTFAPQITESQAIAPSVLTPVDQSSVAPTAFSAQPTPAPTVSAAPATTPATPVAAPLAAQPEQLAVTSENFSAETARISKPTTAATEGTRKKSVSRFEKDVKADSEIAGISTAITGDHMPALSSKFTPVIEVAPASTTSARTDDTAAKTSAPSVSAHAVVENVLAVVDAQASQAAGARSSVNLQFKVGGEALDVRVELRGSEVHTQFRTESPELRAALAQEWNSVANSPSEQGLRLQDPVFIAAPVQNASASGDAFSSALGGDASRQQSQSQTRNRDEFFIPSSLASLRSDGERASENETPTAARTQVSTNRRLHTFA